MRRGICDPLVHRASAQGVQCLGHESTQGKREFRFELGGRCCGGGPFGVQRRQQRLGFGGQVDDALPRVRAGSEADEVLFGHLSHGLARGGVGDAGGPGQIPDGGRAGSGQCPDDRGEPGAESMQAKILVDGRDIAVQKIQKMA